MVTPAQLRAQALLEDGRGVSGGMLTTPVVTPSVVPSVAPTAPTGTVQGGGAINPIAVTKEATQEEPQTSEITSVNDLVEQAFGARQFTEEEQREKYNSSPFMEQVFGSFENYKQYLNDNFNAWEEADLSGNFQQQTGSEIYNPFAAAMSGASGSAGEYGRNVLEFNQNSLVPTSTAINQNLYNQYGIVPSFTDSDGNQWTFVNGEYQKTMEAGWLDSPVGQLVNETLKGITYGMIAGPILGAATNAAGQAVSQASGLLGGSTGNTLGTVLQQGSSFIGGAGGAATGGSGVLEAAQEVLRPSDVIVNLGQAANEVTSGVPPELGQQQEEAAQETAPVVDIPLDIFIDSTRDEPIFADVETGDVTVGLPDIPVEEEEEGGGGAEATPVVTPIPEVTPEPTPTPVTPAPVVTPTTPVTPTPTQPTVTPPTQQGNQGIPASEAEQQYIDLYNQAIEAGRPEFAQTIREQMERLGVPTNNLPQPATAPEEIGQPEDQPTVDSIVGRQILEAVQREQDPNIRSRLITEWENYTGQQWDDALLNQAPFENYQEPEPPQVTGYVWDSMDKQWEPVFGNNIPEGTAIYSQGPDMPQEPPEDTSSVVDSLLGEYINPVRDEITKQQEAINNLVDQIANSPVLPTTEEVASYLQENGVPLDQATLTDIQNRINEATANQVTQEQVTEAISGAGFATPEDVATAVENAGFATAEDIDTALEGLDLNFATAEDVKNAIADAGFATPADIDTAISGAGFSTAEDVKTAIEGAGFATPDDVKTAVENAGFATAEDIDTALAGLDLNFATADDVKNALAAAGFATPSDIDEAVSNAGFATPEDVKTAVEGAGFATPDDIKNAVADAGFATPEDIDDALAGLDLNFATPDDVKNAIANAGFATPDDIDTAVSNAGFATPDDIDTALSNAGFTTPEDVTNALAESGFATTEQLESAIGGLDFAKPSDVVDAIAKSGFATPADIATALTESGFASAEELADLESVFESSLTGLESAFGTSLEGIRGEFETGLEGLGEGLAGLGAGLEGLGEGLEQGLSEAELGRRQLASRINQREFKPAPIPQLSYQPLQLEGLIQGPQRDYVNELNQIINRSLFEGMI